MFGLLLHYCIHYANNLCDEMYLKYHVLQKGAPDTRKPLHLTLEHNLV